MPDGRPIEGLMIGRGKFLEEAQTLSDEWQSLNPTERSNMIHNGTLPGECANLLPDLLEYIGQLEARIATLESDTE